MTMTQATGPSLSRLRLGAHWVWVPVLLLASSALGVGSMAYVAVRDPNFATEPNYYQKAIHWDQTQAQAAQNQRLSYKLTLPAAVAFDTQGLAILELKVQDSFGRPLSGARLAAEAFANAYSAEISQLAFSEREPGVYVATLRVRHRGVWEFRVAGDSDGAHFTGILRADLRPGGAA